MSHGSEVGFTIWSNNTKYSNLAQVQMSPLDIALDTVWLTLHWLHFCYEISYPKKSNLEKEGFILVYSGSAIPGYTLSWQGCHSGRSSLWLATWYTQLKQLAS